MAAFVVMANGWERCEPNARVGGDSIGTRVMNTVAVSPIRAKRILCIVISHIMDWIRNYIPQLLSFSYFKRVRGLCFERHPSCLEVNWTIVALGL